MWKDDYNLQTATGIKNNYVRFISVIFYTVHLYTSQHTETQDMVKTLFTDFLKEQLFLKEEL